MKQNALWRLVAAALSEPDDAAARRHLDTLAASPTVPVLSLAAKLCRSARADERRVGAGLVDALLDARPDLVEGPALREAQAVARTRA